MGSLTIAKAAAAVAALAVAARRLARRPSRVPSTHDGDAAAIAEHAVDLASAARLEIELARDALGARPEEARASLRRAVRANTALEGLLAAAHAHVRGVDDAPGNADGCVRLAVAVLRDRGARVQLVGEGTSLPIFRAPSVVTATLIELVDDAQRDSAGIVRIALTPEAITISGIGSGRSKSRDWAIFALGWHADERGDQLVISAGSTPACIGRA